MSEKNVVRLELRFAKVSVSISFSPLVSALFNEIIYCSGSQPTLCDNYQTIQSVENYLWRCTFPFNYTI